MIPCGHRASVLLRAGREAIRGREPQGSRVGRRDRSAAATGRRGRSQPATRRGRASGARRRNRASDQPGHRVPAHAGMGLDWPVHDTQSFAPMLSGYAGVTYEIAGRSTRRCRRRRTKTRQRHARRGGDHARPAPSRSHRVRAVGREPAAERHDGPPRDIVRTVDGEIVGAGRLDPLQMGVDSFARLYETVDGWVCVVAPTSEEQRALLATLGVDTVDDDQLQSDRLRAAYGGSAPPTWSSVCSTPASPPSSRWAECAHVHERPGGTPQPTRRRTPAPGTGQRPRARHAPPRERHRVHPAPAGAGTRRAHRRTARELGCSPDEIAELRARGAIR